jgi:predicted dehydrogenase
MSLTRRQFLRHSSVAAASLAIPMVAGRSVLGANDEIRVGIIGLGVRGMGAHLPGFEGQKGVRVTAICDPDRQRLDGSAGAIRDKYKHDVEKFVDLRDLIAKKDLDVVTVATMQYWHALPTIWACQAGKDVYCEKPLSHFIWEGRKMVEAARKHKRLVQTGTQSRSSEVVHATMAYVASGQLGKIKYLTAFANKPRTSIGKRTEPLPIPEALDYELWCGPARKEPIFRDRIQYDCSFTWNMGDGESCNQGVHEIDLARWVLDEEKLPRRVISCGGRFVFNDAGDVPNTQIIYYDFPSAPVLYEVHNMTAAKGSKEAPDFLGVRTDTCVHCEGGYVMLRSGFACDNEGKKIKTFSGGEDHFGNFIAAVRAGNRELLHADVLEGHRSTAITHAGNISYRLGKPASAAEIRKSVGDTPYFKDMVERLFTHLKAHEIDVDACSITLGPWLDVDRDGECFKDSAEANALVKGTYREPWVIGEV